MSSLGAKIRQQEWTLSGVIDVLLWNPPKSPQNVVKAVLGELERSDPEVVVVERLGGGSVSAVAGTVVLTASGSDAERERLGRVGARGFALAFVAAVRPGVVDHVLAAMGYEGEGSQLVAASDICDSMLSEEIRSKVVSVFGRTTGLTVVVFAHDANPVWLLTSDSSESSPLST
jgi:hypothetical protein